LGGPYHGSCFAFPSDVPAKNVVDKQDFFIAEYNNVEEAKSKIEESEDVAVVLVEGMQGAGPCIPATREFLMQVHVSSHQMNAVCILDEIMTSRLAPGGIQGLEGLISDRVALGKYLGGGMPFGAFGGLNRIMWEYNPTNPDALAHSGALTITPSLWRRDMLGSRKCIRLM
jgi:glutamate-1-semialdehyde 2,1-aminomutase